MSGNVAEYTMDNQIKGGSWNDDVEALEITSVNQYEQEASPFVGFRPVIVVRKKD